MIEYVPHLLVFTGVTGMPHRPSSSDGQSPVFVLVSIAPTSSNPIGRAQEIARRYARRLTAVANARTVRHWRSLK